MFNISPLSETEISYLREAIIAGYNCCFASINNQINRKLLRPISWSLACSNIWIMFPREHRNLLITIDPNVQDVQIRNRYCDLLKTLKSLDYVFITHLHGDHYNPNVLNLLADTFENCKFVIPCELFNEISRDVSSSVLKRVIAISRQNSPEIDSIRVSLIALPHVIIEHCYGYVFSYKDDAKIFVASDIRDYTKAQNIEADVLFFSTWLGRYCAYEPDIEITKQAAEYIESVRVKKIIFYHLYDTGRNPVDLWRKEHCELILKYMRNAENCEIYIPEPENFGAMIQL